MRTEKVRCPICRGTGNRGHGLWNILTQCVVCAGTGKVEVHARRESRRDLWREFCREEARR
jgi:DnaJ-class molecular chaperone